MVLFLFSKLVIIGVYVMYGFVLAPDCTIYFIYVLNTERAKRARKKYVVQFKLSDELARTFFVLPCF